MHQHWLDLLLSAVNFAAGVVVVAEALNKLERIDVFGLREHRDEARAWRVLVSFLMPWRWGPGTGSRLVQFVAWFACAIGGGGAIMLPFLENAPRLPANVLALAGFAIIIAHARYLEWVRSKQRGVRNESQSLSK